MIGVYFRRINLSWVRSRRITLQWIFAALAATFCVSLSLGQEAPSAAADPVLEQRVKQVSEGLRCLVCQNQSLSDSNAELAADLRNQVREMMQAGKSDAQIRDFMVASYGDFILYDPPLKATTLVLWVGPFVLLVACGAFLARYVSRRRRLVTEQVLTIDERDQARALLNGNQDKAK